MNLQLPGSFISKTWRRSNISNVLLSVGAKRPVSTLLYWLGEDAVEVLETIWIST